MVFAANPSVKTGVCGILRVQNCRSVCLGRGWEAGWNANLWKVGRGRWGRCVERRTSAKGVGCLGREGEEEWRIEERRKRMNARRKERCDGKKGRDIQKGWDDGMAADFTDIFGISRWICGVGGMGRGIATYFWGSRGRAINLTAKTNDLNEYDGKRGNEYTCVEGAGACHRHWFDFD